TGERVWLFGVPPRRLYPASPAPAVHVPLEVRPGGLFDRFRTSGERLLLVQGGRSLLALDVLTGEALWQRYAPGAEFEMPPPHGRVHHVLPLGSDLVLVQASGHGLVVRATDGRTVHSWPGTVTAWQQSPVSLPDGGVLVARDSDRVECLDPRARKPLRWTY